MSIDAKDVKELVEQVIIYVELAAVASAAIQQINALLSKGNDLSPVELQALLRKNRSTIETNRRKIEDTINRDS